MSENISVREWIKRFNNGDFDVKNRGIQIEAGWYDWFCSDQALANRLKKMGNIIKDIKNDFILDNYYVWFKNNCPVCGSLYDDFRFKPLEDNKRNIMYFGIACDDKRREHKYEMFTARSNYNTEFVAANKKELLKMIEQFGEEVSKTVEEVNKIVGVESK